MGDNPNHTLQLLQLKYDEEYAKQFEEYQAAERRIARRDSEEKTLQQNSLEVKQEKRALSQADPKLQALYLEVHDMLVRNKT